ncbi:MAG: hypothetical protein ACW99Q_27725 [Candidatus Kariarchaeaceae archaeon]|jgi:hypothetical protein
MNRDVITNVMVLGLIIGLALMGSNYGTTIVANTEQNRKEQNQIHSSESGNASLTFIPTNSIRNTQFPIVIYNPDQSPIYLKASWEPVIFELMLSDEEKEYYNPGRDPYWIELDGSQDGDGTIQLYQEVNNEISEFSGVQSVKWAIPEITDEFPTKIEYNYDITMGFVPHPGQYTIESEIYDGYANIEYNPSNDLVGPFPNSMAEDGLVFPSFSELFKNVNLTEAKRFQTWIYTSNAWAADGGIRKFTITLHWDDSTTTKLDYHRKLEGSVIYTIYSHNIIDNIHRVLQDSTIEALNNSKHVSSETSALHISAPTLIISTFLIIKISFSRKANRISEYHKL